MPEDVGTPAAAMSDEITISGASPLEEEEEGELEANGLRGAKQFENFSDDSNTLRARSRRDSMVGLQIKCPVQCTALVMHGVLELTLRNEK